MLPTTLRQRVPSYPQRVSHDVDPELRAVAVYLVGPAEISELLGIDANTVNVWKSRHRDFPTPVRRLRSGDLWDRREILAWAEATGRYSTPE